jgi:RNA polymerase sigma-70 factor (ECF subfamily)
MPLLRSRSAPTQLHSAAVETGDRALVTAAQRDPADFAPLFERYWRPVLRYCVVRLGNRQDAEDTASQVFVDAYAGLARFDHRDREQSFRAWLFTIAHHEVASRQRARMRHPVASLSAVDEITDPAGSPEPAALAASAMKQVREVLATLPPRPREVVELRLAGLSDREIAGVLGMSDVAVRQAQSRAVALLRSAMGVAQAQKRTVDD